MIALIPKPIVLEYSSIPLEPISTFDKNEAYILDTLRVYNNNIYKAIDEIPATVHYVWDSTDITNKKGYDLYNDEPIQDGTAVPCVQNVTTVWSIRNKKYYVSKVTGLVDFTAQDPGAPQDFTEMPASTNLRTELSYPNGKKTTLLWKYVAVQNRYVMFDGILNAQTANDRSFTTSLQVNFSTNVCLLNEELSKNIYVDDKIEIIGTTLNNGYYKIASIAPDRLSFTIYNTFQTEQITGQVSFYTQTYIKFNTRGTNRIAIFNTQCDSIEVSVTVDGNTTTQQFDMIDTSHISTFELFCFNEPRSIYTSTFEFEPNYNQEIEITFFGKTQKIGEVIQGYDLDLGKVEDSADINGRVYASIQEAENGDIYVDEEITQNDILERKSFRMIIDSDKIEFYQNTMKDILGKKVVISGSSYDKDDYRFLVTFGLIKDYSFSPIVNDDYSTYKFEIREFKQWLS